MVVVEVAQAGKRLDAALAALLPDFSRTQLSRWVRHGRVQIEGVTEALQPRYRVVGGERVTVVPAAPEPSHLVPEDIPLTILHRDEDLLLVDKPSGLTVHPGRGQPQGTLANALVHHMQGLPELSGADRPGIVHRLDKATSGLMVIALNEFTQRKLAQAFADRRIAKTYLAWVHGTTLDFEGIIDAPIERSRTQRTRMTIAGEGRGRAAQTEWVVEEVLSRHSRVRCHPKTGRTHQLRVHLKSVRHPIVADAFYGGRGRMGDELAPRLMLHAHELTFDHPRTGERQTYTSPIPPDLAEAEAKLRALDPPRRR